MTKGNKTKKKEYTPINKLNRQGNKLNNAFSELSNMQLTSWVDFTLPDMLWADLLVSSLKKQDLYLEKFRDILREVRNKKDTIDIQQLTHSENAKLTYQEFESIYGVLIEGENISNLFAPLLCIESLPDLSHWKKILPKAKREADWTHIAEAIYLSYWHQSQEATDIRWLRLMTLAVKGKLIYPKEMTELVEQLDQYPNLGDMRKIRPHIRATEIMTRPGQMGEGEPPSWCADFWDECFKKTECISIGNKSGKPFNSDDLFNQLVQIHENLTHHFLNTIKTTAIDPKHDGAFGLVFYMLNLLAFSLKALVGRSMVGRLILRTVFETYATLQYLTKIDSDTVWAQYRNYGAGQTKLSFLKQINSEEIPSYIDLKNLELLANEDMWLEFVDINLGVWANKNLRQICIDAGIKDEYDRYYDHLSGYVHASWGAVRESTFITCVNPLHRFHRVPAPPNITDNETSIDIAKLCNKAIVSLNKLYPRFSEQFKNLN